MDWSKALKVGGPSAVITYVFYSLINSLISKYELLRDSLIFNIILLITIFLFCIFVCYRVTMPKEEHSDINKIDKNEIENNEVDSSLNIGLKNKNSDITKNKVKNNKVKGDLNVG